MPYRYGKRQSLIAIKLTNEPWAEDNSGGGIPLDTLKQYYQEGFNAVRKYTSDAYVILSNRLGIMADQLRDLLNFATTLDDRVVIDVDYYNVYEKEFENMNVEQTKNYIYGQRASQLEDVTTPKMVSAPSFLLVSEYG